MPAGAQESGDASEGDVMDLSLDALLEIEIDSVYGASKRVQNIREAPSSVTIVTADDIRKFGYRTLLDVLSGVRGFYFTNDRNYERIGVRGSNPPGDYSTRILVLVDGHRINDQVYDSPGYGQLFPVDIDLVKKVEVIRGPGSSLYGSNAFLAVVNVITKTGKELDGFEVEGNYGEFETYKGRVTFGKALENGVELLLSGTVYDSEGDRLFYDEFSDSSSGGYVDNDYEEAYSFFSQVSWSDFTFQGFLNSREKGIPTASFETVFGERSQTTDERIDLDLKYHPDFEGPWGLVTRLAYADIEYSADYVYDYDEDETPPYTTNKDEARGRSVSADVQASNTGIERHWLTFGVEVRHLFELHQKNFDDDVYLDDDRSNTNWGVFAQDEIELSDAIDLSVGLRHDDYEEFGGTTNPRVGLIYRPVENTGLKLIYGQAFRAPNAYETYYGDNGETAKGNTDLDPETIESVELIWEQDHDEQTRSTLSVFQYTVDDLITQIVDPADDLLVFQNTEETEAHGAEMEFDRRWTSGWRANLSHTWQESENSKTGENLVNSPKNLSKLKIVAPIIAEKVFAGLEVRYTSERDTLAGDTADDFVLTNLTLLSTLR